MLKVFSSQRRFKVTVTKLIEQKMFSIFLITSLDPVVQRVYNAIYQINCYPGDSVVCVTKTYPLDSDLSCGYHYPLFKQWSPDVVCVLL